MIQNEYYRTRSDGVRLYRTWSDLNMMILREDGQMFGDAIDVETSGHTYTETDAPIDELE